AKHDANQLCQLLTENSPMNPKTTLRSFFAALFFAWLGSFSELAAAASPMAQDGLANKGEARVGQSITPLPDGRMLLAGGEHNGTISEELHLVDPLTQHETAPAGGLANARSGHTATVLPDGTVLILGGVGRDGHVLMSAERFDPAGKRSLGSAIPGLLARAWHTATLMTDGR